MSPQTSRRDWFHLVLRIVIGVVFVYAAIPKIISPGEFYLNILGYDLIGGQIARIIALWIPWLELLGGLGVIFGVWYLVNLRIVQGLLSGFIILLVVTLVRGIQTECGCFGSGLGQISWWHLFGNLVLLMVTTFLISWARFQQRADVTA